MLHNAPKSLIAIASIAALMGLAACGDRTDTTSPTVGQQMDSTAERTAQATQETRQEAQEVAQEAREEAREAQQAAREATEEAREKTADAAQATREAAEAVDTTVMGAAGEAKDKAKAAGATLGEKIDDAQIVMKLNAGYAADKDLSSMKIDVDSKEGMVTLSGTVPSAAAKERAETMAKNTKDVKTVNNQLTVKG